MLRVDLQTCRFDSLESLTDHAEPWHDLWRRSDDARPAALVATLAAWFQSFAPDHLVRVPVVRGGDGRWLAAILLHGPRRCRYGWPASLPTNPWNPDVGLLWDHQAANHATADRLADEILACGFPTMRWLDVPIESAPWAALIAALRNRLAHVVITPGEGNLVFDLSRGAKPVLEQRSANLRKKLRKARRRLERQGDLRVRVESPTDESDALVALGKALAIEHAGWKGKAGSSIRSVPEANRFFQDLVAQAAYQNALRVSFLELDGQPIAFEIGTVVGHTYHSTKVSYDESFANHSPGNLLMESLFEHFADHGVTRIDCLSPPTPTLMRWGPNVERRARVFVARPGIAGRAIATAYAAAIGFKRRSFPRRGNAEQMVLAADE